MRELNVQALKYMDGQRVIVHDCEYDEFDQICTVHIVKKYINNHYKKKPPAIEVITEIRLENEEFLFQYVPPLFNKCMYGDFKVYSLH